MQAHHSPSMRPTGNPESPRSLDSSAPISGSVAVARGEKLLKQARAAINEQHIEVARDLLARADECAEPGHDLIDERVARLRMGVKLSAAWVTFEDDTLTAAAEELSQVRASAVTAGYTDVAALCDMQLGTLRGRSGDLVGALDALYSVEAGRASLEPVAQVRLLINRGGALGPPQGTGAGQARPGRGGLLGERQRHGRIAVYGRSQPGTCGIPLGQLSDRLDADGAGRLDGHRGRPRNIKAQSGSGDARGWPG